MEITLTKQGLHLDREVLDVTVFQHFWHRMAVQLAILYAALSGKLGHRLTEIMAAKWQVVINRSWNSERPLVFNHFILTNILGVRRAKEIRTRVTRRTKLWNMGLHAGLVGGV